VLDNTAADAQVAFGLENQLSNVVGYSLKTTLGAPVAVACVVALPFSEPSEGALVNRRAEETDPQATLRY
jgi:hypothetical protein